MVSGCDLLDVVEAAHIWPYRGVNDNHPDNGLLLRADLHTLFDLDLMAIHPDELAVRLHPLAITAGYGNFEGRALGVPDRAGPSKAALALRWECFRERLEG